MPGGYDDKMVKQAVGMELQARWIEPGRVAEVTVGLRAGRVGHRVPGGEELRFLTVRTEVTGSDGQRVGTRGDDHAQQADTETGSEEEDLPEWPIVETLRRYMGDREHGRDPSAAPAPDTRLRPGETRRYSYRITFEPGTVAGALTVRSRLWYHLMHDGKARLFRHRLEDVQRVVRESEVHLDPPQPTTTGR